MPPIPSDLSGIPGEALERIRLAILDLKIGGSGLTVAAVREVAKVDQRRVGPVLRAFRAGEMPPLGQPWSGAPQTNHVRIDSSKKGESARLSDVDDHQELRDEFARAVEDAETDEDRERLAHKLLVLGSKSVYSSSQVQAFKALLTAATQSAKEKRASADEVDRQRMILCTDEGWRLVRVYEGIVSDDRRKEILRHVVRECRKDLEERPNTDLGAA